MSTKARTTSIPFLLLPVLLGLASPPVRAATFPPYVYSGTLKQQCPIWRNEWRTCSAQASASFPFSIAAGSGGGTSYAAASGTAFTSFPAGPVSGVLLEDQTPDNNDVRMALDVPVALVYQLDMSATVPSMGTPPYSLELEIRGGSRLTRCNPVTVRKADLVAGASVTIRETLSCSLNEAWLHFPSSNEPVGTQQTGTMFLAASGNFRDKNGLGVGYVEAPAVTGELTYVNQGKKSTAKVTDIDPAVCRNYVPSDVPLRATVTGSGFQAGSTVSIGGGVRVMGAPTVSADGKRIDLTIGGFKDLAEGLRDVEVRAPDGTVAKAAGIFYVSGLVLSPLEVNQGVEMECTAKVPCVADHRTIVRARVEYDAAIASSRPSFQVTARLHVFASGTTTPLAGSPFRPTQKWITLRTTAEAPPPSLDTFGGETLNFFFKGGDALPAGSWDLVLEVVPHNPALSASGTGPDAKRNLLERSAGRAFRKAAAAMPVFAVVDREVPAAEAGRLLVDVARSLGRDVAAALPLSRSEIAFVPLPSSAVAKATSFEAAKEVWLDLFLLSSTLQAQRPAGNPAHLLWFGSLPSYRPGQLTIWNGCAADPLRGAAACGSPFSLVSMPGGEIGEAIRMALPHVFGHHFGLGDTHDVDLQNRACYVKVASTANPRFAGCDTDGCPCDAGNFDTLAGRVSTESEPLPDMMGEKYRSSWTDRRSWAHVYRTLMGIDPATGRPLGAARAAAEQDLLLVSGSIAPSGAGSFGRFARVTKSPPAAGPAGEYAVEIQAASGSVLASQSFPVDLSILQGSSFLSGFPFVAQLPWTAGASRVVLRKGSQVLATRAVSAGVPTVRLSSPVGGESLSGTATVAWSGSDPDGDALTYSVDFSADGGTTWLPLATRLATTTFAWNTAISPGTKAGRIRVVASDGVNEGRDASPASFTVASKDPAVAVTSPADGTVVAPGTPVTFEGTGFDLEDGLLPGSSLAFVSSRDGLLGTGETVAAPALSPGLHAITLTATDRDGNRGTASVSVNVFSPSAAPSAVRFVPVVLTSPGAAGSFYTSELVLTNRGTTDAVMELRYVSFAGGGDGTVYDSLGAGRQKVLPDATAYLTSLGLPIPAEGARVGTIRVAFHGLSSPDAGAATVRTTTAVPSGRAGLSYPAVLPSLLTGPAYLCGLKQDESDRSNVALANAGAEADGGVTLRLTVFSGDPAAPQSKVLPDVALPPGGWTQLGQVLASNGLSLRNGYVKVERASGTAPFYAYGVVNDQLNSDGSFVPPVLASELTGKQGITLPVAVEAGPFTTEVVVTNFGAAPRTVRLTYVAGAVEAADDAAVLELTLAAGEQRFIPSFVQFLRDRKVPGVGPAGPTFAGPVFLAVPGGDVSGLAIGARTAAPGGGGRFGLFTSGVPAGAAAEGSAWLFGLRQDAENRTNVAIVNTGERDGSPSSFRVELFDGATGALAGVADGITVGARGFTQKNAILSEHAPSTANAWARVTRAAGSNPFVAYAVVNDGGAPGVRSDDGAFVAMETVAPPVVPPLLDVTPSALSFGSLTVGQTKDLAVTVTNRGGGTLTGSASAEAPFSVTAGGAFSLGPGQSQTTTVRFAPTSAAASSGLLPFVSNGGNASVALSGTGTAAAESLLELLTDDGTVETGVVQNGLFIANRLTPGLYPATLRKIRIFVAHFANRPDPSGSAVRVLAFVDPEGSGRPPVEPRVLFDQTVTLPSIPVEGAWVDVEVPGAPPLASGDLYVGFRAPTPAGGVGFAADTNGSPQNRGFYSLDGGVRWQGPLVLQDALGNQTPANMMIRAVVAVPS